MKCAKCAFENADGASFCGLCYEVLKKEAPAPGPDDDLASARLKAAMVKVCEEDTPKTRGRLYSELLEAILLVPKTDQVAFGRITPASGERVDFPMVELTPDVTGLAVFTGATALRAWRRCGYVLMRGQNLFLMANHMGAQAVAVNPGSSPAGLLLAWEVQRLAEGSSPAVGENRSIPGGVQGKVGWKPRSQPLPARLEEALRDFLGGQPQIARAYALEASFNGAAPRLVVAVSFPINPGEALIGAIMPALVKLSERHGADATFFIVEETGWLAQVSEKARPFFERV